MTERKKVTLTKRRVNEMYGAMMDLERNNDPLSQKFAYALAYNMDAIEVHVKSFNRHARTDKPYLEYENARVELAKEYAIKDRNNEPVMKRGVYDMKDQFAFEQALEVLREKHPAYQKREDQLDETVEVEFHTVQKMYVPEFLGLAYMKPFYCFIVENDNEFECPACGAELYMEGHRLREFKKPESEKEVEPDKEEETQAEPERRRKRTGT